MSVKKIISTVLSATMLLTGIPLVAVASEKSFDVTETVIVIQENASETDSYAAQKLKYYLDEIIGGDIEIVTENEETDSGIFVGKTEKCETDFSSSADGSYVIKSSEKAVIISGAGNKGTINGVYAFLEKYCGCHWYEAEVIVIPENKELTVPAGINDEYTPFFEYTETDTASSRDTEFSLANGLYGGVYRDFTAEQGSAVEYVGRFAHTLTTVFCKGEDYFADHPEYFALHGGKRTPDQLCLTNEKTIDIVTQEVLALLAQEHNPEADIQIVSLTQHDNLFYCECEKCKAVDDENGSHSGTMISFVNEVARRVKENGGYDNVVFDTFAYQYTRKAPSVVKPREDVIVRLCSIECCFGHALDDKKCELNADFMNDLKAWSKICNRIYIWDYVNNYRETVCIFPNFGVLQRNVQIFYENNVKGLYEEGNYYIDSCDAEFGEMRTYLLSKLMQNPYLDYSEEMSGYLNAVYGEGGRYIREFIDIMTEHAVTDSDHLSIYQASTETLYGITDEEIEYCNGLWKKAKAEAKTDDELARIRRSELSWSYWQSANKRGAFSRKQFPYLYMKAGEELHNGLIEMGIVAFSEGYNGALSDCELLYLYRPVTKWGTLFEEWFWDILNPFAIALYKFFGAVYSFKK